MALPSSWSDIPLESSATCPRTWTASGSPPCPQWRAAAREVPLPSPLPLLALPDGIVHSLCRDLWQLAGLLNRGRLLPEGSVLQRHRDTSSGVPRPSPMSPQ
ncbi:unnamed protein product [Miscanthus lutarioriparius]|uniref:Uncharacterized protein n=1 Tax=Miscanthus lutarioriparius TaxID=422564 RepID=A0A811Q950_9POAL|nr:unnamed protein product [Miscanthus lutarioriparius]